MLVQVGGASDVRYRFRRLVAGLGGGSSDAAAVLLGLNNILGNPVSPPDLLAIGSRIGKDIPFFLTSAPAAVVSGMGEVVDPLPSFPPLRFLVANPMVSMPTIEAYKALAQSASFMSDSARIDVTGIIARAIQSGDCAKIAAMPYNDFESHVESRLPVVKQLKQCMVAFGAMGALMSGSGPTKFGLFDSKEQQHIAERAIRRYHPSFQVFL